MTHEPSQQSYGPSGAHVSPDHSENVIEPHASGGASTFTEAKEEYEEEHGEANYEERDARARPLVIAASILSAIAIFSLVFVWGMIAILPESMTPSANQPQEANLRLPAEPRLQEDPEIDGDTVIAQQNEVLETYNWLDRDTGRVRLPIERAMEIVVERGVVPTSDADPTSQPQP